MSRIFAFTLANLLVAGGLQAEVAFPAQPLSPASSLMAPSDSQLLDRPAHLSVTRVPLASALQQLSETSGVRIAFSPTRLPARSVVSCSCGDRTVGEALERLLAGTDFGFEEIGAQVVVSERVPTEGNGSSAGNGLLSWDQGPPRALALGPPTARELRSARLRDISGAVRSRSGEPVSGVEVLVQGSSVRALTDADGRFILRGVGAGEVVLELSRLGFRQTSHRVQAGESEVRIIMEPVPIRIDEMIVVGTAGGAERRSIGNSVSTIDMGDVGVVTAGTHLGQVLNARAPGVVITSPAGYAMAPTRVLIRGASSLALPINPLIYVDGVRVDNRQSGGAQRPGSRLNDFSPGEIENIEIIKGAAAATLYGTEAANGVIHITTRRGTPGAARIDVSMRQGISHIANPEGRWPENYFVNSETGQVENFNIIEEERRRGNRVLGNGHGQGYSVNVHGGTDAIQYFSSLQFDKDQGSVSADTYERLGGRLNVTVAPSGQFRFDARFGASRSDAEFVNWQFPWAVFMTNPSLRDGPQRGFGGAPPENLFSQYDQTEAVDHVTAGFEVQHHHPRLEWLSQRLRIGIDLTSQTSSELYRNMPPEHAQFFSPAFSQGRITVSEFRRQQATVDYNATVSMPLMDDRLLSSSSLGLQHYRSSLNSVFVTGVGFPAPSVTTPSSASNRTGGGSAQEGRTVGVYLQQQMAWENRLFLTGAIRGDDNSAFGRDFDFVVYPKVMLSWVLTEEPRWNLEAVDHLRLRLAWGMSGQQPSTFDAVRSFASTQAAGNLPAVTPQSFGNPLLGPEKSKELELGFETMVLDNRLGLDFTWYRQTTTDAILRRPAAPSSGFAGTVPVNVGEVRNQGIEALLSATVLRRDGVTVDLGLNLSRNQNEVMSLGIEGLEFLAFGDVRLQPGFPVHAVFVRRVLSADRGPDGMPVNVMCDGGVPRVPGGPPLLSGGTPVDCASAPMLFRGTPNPKWDGAVTGDVSFGGRFRLYAMMDFKLGHVNRELRNCNILGCEEQYFPERYSPETVADVLDRIGGTWQDVSFAKLREVSLTYFLPDDRARSFGMSRASISLAGRNLWQKTRGDFRGMDPENQDLFLEVVPQFGGFDQGLPQLRQFVTRINFSF
jgi:TonB-dependent starch-binding outer membrane protein SusC